MTVNEYRNETTAKLVKLDERQITWGSVALFVIPMIVTIIMRLIT